MKRASTLLAFVCLGAIAALTAQEPPSRDGPASDAAAERDVVVPPECDEVRLDARRTLAGARAIKHPEEAEMAARELEGRVGPDRPPEGPPGDEARQEGPAADPALCPPEVEREVRDAARRLRHLADALRGLERTQGDSKAAEDAKKVLDGLREGLGGEGAGDRERAGAFGDAVDRSKSGARDAAAVEAGLDAGGAGASPDAVRLRIAGDKPEVDDPVLHSWGSAKVAPKPGWITTDAFTREGPIIREDLRTIREHVQTLELPENLQDLHPTNASSQRQFFAWLKKTFTEPKPGETRRSTEAIMEDLPDLYYDPLEEGEIGRYDRGLITKSDVYLNHYIKDDDPRARTAALVHELYHYWDKEVAKNHYPNVSYGYIDPESKHKHEYGAYQATTIWWDHVRTKKDKKDRTPLEEYFDGMTYDENGELVEPGAFRRDLDAHLKAHHKEKE